MNKHNFFYFIKEGAVNMFSHGFMSFASVGITVACLLIMGTFTLVAVNANAMLAELESQNQVLAFVEKGMSEAEARALEKEILAVDNVASATFISNEEAAEVFRGRYEDDELFQLPDDNFRHRYAIDLVDIGYTAAGDHVIMNKYVYDADIAILIGHTQGNPYGGYSGGYKHCATGISHWRSISAHHVPKVMHQPDFVPVSTSSVMRGKFDQQGMLMEEKMGKKFFCCDAVLDTKSRQIAIFSGWAKEMQPLSWEVADKRTYVPWAEKKYDVMVFGMPQNFHYGDGMGTNPIQMMQALSAQVIRHKRIMSDRCVFIVSSFCDAWFHEERWPYLRELYEMFQHDSMNILPDMDRYGEYFATKEEYIRKYRFANAFHPFHGFSMMSCGHLAEEHTSAIYIVGAREPGIARSMGLKTRATFEEAIADAMKKYTGPNPNILALPRTFTTAAVHLCMKDPALNGAPVTGHPCGG